MAGLSEAQLRRTLDGCRTLQLVALAACTADVMALLAFTINGTPRPALLAVAAVTFAMCAAAGVVAVLAERAVLHSLRERR